MLKLEFHASRAIIRQHEYIFIYLQYIYIMNAYKNELCCKPYMYYIIAYTLYDSTYHRHNNPLLS